jgi:hypothetical protein
VTDVDDAVADARVAQERRRGDAVVPLARRPARGRGGLKARAALIVGANLAILVVAFVLSGVLGPLGLFGGLAMIALMLAATLLIAFAPATPLPTPERLARSELKALPAQTTRWLEAQRPALPAPAVSVLDRLGQRLDTLGVQLATLDEDSPAATDVRRLVGEQLPAFIDDYKRVPRPLRSTPRNGKTPDQQLVEGLGVIEREVASMSEQLAQGDLDTLATRGRFLEIKYAGDEGASA